MHSLLQRQIKRHLVNLNSLPQECQNLLQAVDEAYRQFDDDRAMLERSLELSSEELLQANTKLQELLNAVAVQVEERTAELARTNAELKQTLADLQKAQVQMVQNEKMASLGNLLAGVAHEINNPIGFLNGSINNAKDYVRDLLEYLALYQQHHPQVAEAVQERAENIELEFLCEDLPQLLNSMKNATDRIKTISTDLCNFSRADMERKVSANLHEGIDSTLLILKYRLKANEHRPKIEVIKDYGNLPPIKCFPGQINQVFMNILANAIDALEESNLVRTREEIKANPNRITIRTEMTDRNCVSIAIADNGPGMMEDVKRRIFDHLFTTKGIGKGTGLGLAIARQIVVEKHGGTIEVNSVLGEGTEFAIALPVKAR